MGPVSTVVAAALVGGAGMAFYALLIDRPSPPVANVIDPQAYGRDGDAAMVTPATPAPTPAAAATSSAPLATPPLPPGDGPPAGAPAASGLTPVNARDETMIAARLCASHGADPGGAATLFGHFAQAQTATSNLSAAPAGFGGGNCSQIHRDAAGPLAALYAAARHEAPAVGQAMYGLSCFRSIPRQADLYCRADRIATRGYAGQARWVAPPGFSEHATGYSLDFGNRDGNCNLEPCFAGTAVGRWLAANAGRFGFRLSFPQGNAQGVSYEPWHYRYVGGNDATTSPHH